MTVEKNNTALLVIDIQEKILTAMHDKDMLINNAEKLINSNNILGLPIISTVQYPSGLGSTISKLSIIINNNPYHREFEKFEFSCVRNENIFNALKELSCKNIIVIGIEAHVCVQQTVIDLLEDGNFNPIVVADCISSRKEIDKHFALKRMRDYGADITTYEAVIFNLLLTSRAPEFKEISKLIK